MNLIKVALIIAFSLVLVACKSTRLKDINKNIRVLTLNEIKLTSGEPYTFSSWKCKDYFEGGKLIIEVGVIDGISNNATVSNVDNEFDILNTLRVILSSIWEFFLLESLAFILRCMTIRYQ